jgi:hypothetical protein
MTIDNTINGRDSSIFTSTCEKETNNPHNISMAVIIGYVQILGVSQAIRCKVRGKNTTAKTTIINDFEIPVDLINLRVNINMKIKGNILRIIFSGEVILLKNLGLSASR